MTRPVWWSKARRDLYEQVEVCLRRLGQTKAAEHIAHDIDRWDTWAPTGHGMTPEIRGALLKIEAHLENHDAHHADCACNFCDALSLVQNLRRSLRPTTPASSRPLHEVT